MKVFISWSGDRSRAVAELLDDWIQCVLQAVRPWMSARDIDRGSLWFTEINDQLKEVSTGIVCLTKENKDRAWILFESGALARGLSSQRVMTFLVDLSPIDIGDPLAQFNHTLPTEAGLRSLVSSINARLGDLAVSPRTLENVFETYWPQFKSRFSKIIEEVPETRDVPERTEENKIDEVLNHVRSMDKRLRAVEHSRDIYGSVQSRHSSNQIPLSVQQERQRRFDELFNFARSELRSGRAISQVANDIFELAGDSVDLDLILGTAEKEVELERERAKTAKR